MNNLTFGIIKPDAVRAGDQGKIVDRILNAGFKIRGMKLIHQTRKQAEGFYAVHAGKGFRFSHLNTTVGGGMRYRTVIGPIRLDVGYRPTALQRASGPAPSDAPQTDLGFTRFNGAIHLTIGESF